MLIGRGCALWLLCAAACGHEGAPAVLDGSVESDSGDAGPTDTPDAPAPDGPVADTTPPMLVAVAPQPNSDAWLHEPIRFSFDEPIVLSGVTLTAKVAGAPVPATFALDGDRQILVTIDAAARGVGTLELALGSVRDLSGNAIAIPITNEHTLAPWSRPTIDRGVAGSSPAVAVSDSGAVVAAWTVGAGGARRVVVSWHEHGIWQSLGTPLATSDASSPSVALDGSDRPVVAWIEAGSTRIARWDGASWNDLPSLGAASAIAIASPPGGGTITALAVGGSAQVSLLVNDAWQPLGSLALGGALVGEPAIAVSVSGRAAVGWIASATGTATLHVQRYTTSWSAMAPIVLGAPPSGSDRMSIAARDQTIAVAWDQWGGSFAVFAAKATGTTTAWTRLGRTLDVDVAGDATAPAIALDATSAPIVAWRERIETAERGVIARWSGTAWTIVGGTTFLASATAVPTPPTLALHRGQAAVVGFSQGGAIGIARLNGPKLAAFGLQSRPSIAGCAFSIASPPARLRQTGCFTVPTPGKPAPHAGLVPYDIVAELWSDGAKKRRWVALPDGASMTTSSTGAWAAPVGTIVIKEFALETTPGNPATRRAIETRFLVRGAAGWEGFTYQWRLDGSDADLLNDGVFTYDWPMDAGGTHTHIIRAAASACRVTRIRTARCSAFAPSSSRAGSITAA